MEALHTLGQQLSRMQWSDYLDILLVAFLIYKLLPLIRSTGALRVVKVIATLLIIAWLTELLQLHTLNFLLVQLCAVGLIAVIVLFQPELRRMLDHLDNMHFKKFFTVNKNNQEMDAIISQTVTACDVMSREHIGALMVFARNNSLEEYFKTGTVVDGKVSDQLIRNIFFPNASLHDGAMIIRGGRIAAAGCVLPLSSSNRISADLGTRHRAGIGLSEVSDAVVVIVSEESGAISVAIGGMLKRHLAPQTLERLLHNELCGEDEEKDENLVVKLRQKLQRKGKESDESEK